MGKPSTTGDDLARRHEDTTLAAVSAVTPWFPADDPVNIWVYGTFSGTVVIEQSADGGATAVPKWPASVYEIDSPRVFADAQPEPGVLIRARCSVLASGAIEVRFSS